MTENSATENIRAEDSVGVTGLVLALTLGVLAPEPVRLQARFIGNMAFAITDGRTTLFTDFPYQSGAFGYMTYDSETAHPGSGDLCLVTHGHLDHFDPALFAKMNARLVAPPSLVAKLPAARAIPFGKEMTYRDIRIEAFRTPHGQIEHYSYLVNWNGLRLYFTGDTESPDQLLAMRNLDAAFVSPWLVEEVANRKARIDTRRLIVYHHKAGETIAGLQGRIVPKQGESFTLDFRR